MVSQTTAATVSVPVGAGRSYLVQRPSAPTASLPFAQVTATAAGTSRALTTANDTLIDLWTCNGGNNQKWTRS